MEADVPVTQAVGNPCCAVWQEKYAKIQESRNKLRQAVKDSKTLLLQLDRIQSENLRLKKAYDEEQARAETEKDGKEKETAVRISLENEILALRTEISSLQQKGGSDCEDRSEKVEQLQVCVSEGEKEISKLKELLEKEKTRAHLEKKNAELDKKKREQEISKLKELLEKEKTRADSEKKNAEVDKKKREQEISKLKDLLEKENIRADSEKKNAEADKKKGGKEISNLRELLEKEKTRADLEKKNAEMEKKKATDAWKQLNAEMSKADKERRLASVEGKKADEYRLQLEALKKEADKAKAELVSKTSKFEKLNKNLQAEKKMVIKERKRADFEMSKAEEQRKLVEAIRKQAAEEKSHAEKFSRQLDEAMQKIEELQKEIYELVSRNLDEAPRDQADRSMNTEAAQMKKRLWLEMLNRSPDESKLVSECLKSDQANKKFEIEKQNALSEKKRADSEILKAEEERKLAEVWKKMALDEKRRADQLSQELGQGRRTIEQLQTQMHELSSSRKLPGSARVCSNKDTAESLNVKLLKKQLKIEKLQAKHFKEVAKLEKSRNSILQQELGHLKQDFVQFSDRLDVLHKCFSTCGEGTYEVEKAGDLVNLQMLKLKGNVYTLEPFCKNESLKPISVSKAASDPRVQILQQTAPALTICGGCCVESMSGINSQLESLLGGSNQKMLQSSAINSSMASFSDGQFVGSQERGSLSVTPSTNLIEENLSVQPTGSSMSGEVTKIMCYEKHTVAAENSVRSPLRTEVGANMNGRKRKWINNAIKSVGSLYSKSKKLNVQIEEKLCVLHDMLSRHADKPLEEAKLVVPYLLGDSPAEHDRPKKKRKTCQDEKGVKKHLLAEAETKIHGNTDVFRQDAHCSNNISVSEQALREILDDSVAKDGSITGDFEAMRHFDQVTGGNYMRLLDLDNVVDEECYKKALEVPLSPTLPALDFQDVETFTTDNFKPSIQEAFSQGLSNKKENLVPFRSFDTINVETDSTKSLLHENETIVVSIDKPKNNGKCQTLNPQLEMELSNALGSEVERIKVPRDNELCSARVNIPKFCIVFSDVKDSGSISRVFCATSHLSQCLLGTERDWIVHKILLALKKEEKLLSREKVCVFFSLLLLNFYAVNLEWSARFLDQNFVSCSNSFAAHVSAVMSDVEARSVFLEICLDELLCLIEDFLIHGRVMEYTDESSEELLECQSRINMDGLNVILCSKAVSVGHLVAGSILLSSICVAVNHIGFICKASYNILRICRHDTSAVLTILHIFAYVGGERYINPKEHNLTMTVVKSMVTFLETESLSAPAASCLCSASSCQTDFNPGAKCPFSEDATSADVIVSLLLEKLQKYAETRAMNQDLVESVNLANFVVLNHNDDTQQSSSHEDVHCILNMNCDASSQLNQLIPATHSGTLVSGTLCDLMDVLSMVELLACKMGWKWTSEQIVPCLLKVLESSLLGNLAVAVVILLGQLGRLGVDAGGYEDKGVENLRSVLSSFLMQDATIGAGLPIQIATINALLGLLSVDFGQVVRSGLNLMATTSQWIYTDCMRRWFSSLSKEQQALSFSLLQVSGETTS